MLYLWLSKKQNWPLVFWVLLSLGMLICPSFFWINDYISHPQHQQFDCFETIAEIIQKEENKSKEIWYILFFILDFAWAFLTLSIIGSTINGSTFSDFIRLTFNHWIIKVYVIIASIAYLADFLEGILYLTYTSSNLELVTNIKIIGYIICVGFFLCWLLKQVVTMSLTRSFLRFLRTSLFSLFFIIAIYLLVTLMPQGGTLVVHLFYEPLNVVILFFLLMFLSIILSHYPVYIDIWGNDDKEEVRLKMDSRPIFLGFGIVYYDTSELTANSPYRDEVVKSLRRSLGILLYVAVFNIMFIVISRYFEIHLNALNITLAIFVITVFIYHLEGKTYRYWMGILHNPKVTNATLDRNINYILAYVRGFPFYFILCVVGSVVVTLIAHNLNWHMYTVLSFMIVLGLQMFLYIMFKISRTFLKYAFFTRELYFKNRRMFDRQILQRFIEFYKRYPEKRPSTLKLLLMFGNLSDNITYLRLMRFSGFLSLVVILWANYNIALATFLNPIVIILFYIILIYSLFVILFKHILYYNRVRNARFKLLFRVGIPLMLILIIGVAAYGSRQNNDLHELKKVVRKTDSNLNTYLKNRIEQSDSLKKNYFFIGSYGGGLKANLWNLLLLNELDSIYQGEFFPRTLVMSGVSGGAVGIGNYTSLVANIEDSKSYGKEIWEIGKSNVLSNELVYLLGRDWLREYNPWSSHEGKDRSYQSMKIHANLTKFDSFNKVGYEDLWYEAYNKRNGEYPFLIMNSTSVGGQQGVAPSIRFPKTFFPGATITNSFNQKGTDSTLTYYGAVSTTNRFPIFSPTAKIKEKGSFIDGGYFENSGLLSAMQVYDAIEKDNPKDYNNKVQPIFINIINSKDFYVKQKLKEYNLAPNYKRDPSEYQSIIETVTSTNIVPNYILEKLKSRGFAVELIMMPHKISLKDVESSIRGEVEDPLVLLTQIKKHNDSIDNALKRYDKYLYEDWGVVEPPLARLLSEPAVRYQEAMIKEHPLIREKIDYLMGNYIESSMPVDVRAQDSIKQVKRQIDTKAINLKRIKL